MKQNQFKKRRITPLALLSQVKKNNNPLSISNEPILNFPNFKQKPKSKSRYSQQQLQDKPPSPKKRYLNKVEEIIKTTSRKSSKSLRFHSMQREKPILSSSISKLPTSTHKKRLNTQEKTKEVDLVSKIKNRIQKCKTQTKKQQIQAKRVLLDKPTNVDTIFKHFQNLWMIQYIIKTRKKDQEVICAIKNYVLDERADASNLQNVYACPQAQRVVKMLLFFERLVIVLVVDLMINNKVKLAQNGIRSTLNNIIEFYGTVYRDLHLNYHIEQKKLPMLVNQVKIYLGQSQKQQAKSLMYYKDWISSKLKAIIKFSKSAQNFYKFHLKNAAQFSSNLTYFKLLQFYSFSLLGFDWSEWKIQFLQTCPSPYLHHESQKKYTLALDLDQTLIHYKVSNNYQGQFLIRPYLFQFLQQVAPYYQIGIFTCSLPQYADIIINHMKEVSFRLYRHHTIKINGQYVKDLSRVGRDLNKIILVDNIERNFRLQKPNGILIRSWYGDKKDTMLKKLGKQLVELVERNPQNIQEDTFERSFT